MTASQCNGCKSWHAHRGQQKKMRGQKRQLCAPCRRSHVDEPGAVTKVALRRAGTRRVASAALELRGWSISQALGGVIPFVLVSAALATHDSARGQVKEEMRSVQAVWFRVKGKGMRVTSLVRNCFH